MQILHGDCKERLRELIAQGIQVDAIVTDPPYELGFMNKGWDKTGIANDVEMWKLCWRILKPGGHLLSFGGTRTYHRMTCTIEDAGFEIRDCIMWIYGSGFPKSHDISKAIDKKFGAEREVVGKKTVPGSFNKGIYANSNFENQHQDDSGNITAPATELAKQWSGFGTALKPAHEPIVLARKPLSEKTVADNVLRHGVGGLNIDGCRIELDKDDENLRLNAINHDKKIGSIFKGLNPRSDVSIQDMGYHNSLGRFPANVIHDGSEEVEAEFAKYGENKSSASRFFYCAKASKSEKNMGLFEREMTTTDDGHNKSIDNSFQCGETLRHNNHPTVKPLALIKYLCRLITPSNGLVLDPFMGSGTTGVAAKKENFDFIGIEKEAEYIEIAKVRIEEH